MKLLELVKVSDFQKYYFLCLYNDVKDNVYVEGNALFDFSNIESDDFYSIFDGTIDLGKHLAFYVRNAESFAKLLDRSKYFKVDFIEHENDILYIHLQKK